MAMYCKFIFKDYSKILIKHEDQKSSHIYCCLYCPRRFSRKKELIKHWTKDHHLFLDLKNVKKTGCPNKDTKARFGHSLRGWTRVTHGVGVRGSHPLGPSGR
ncbi:unnamed protein product [Calypogeia fissa]